ncbi:hypothetical protein [Bacillus sp. JCM 19041]|uniref:hypothetical protein n=1 Tax=Bacillus sp. JCM 19041 TaxID=1460637 RepID=UPI0006D00AE0
MTNLHKTVYTCATKEHFLHYAQMKPTSFVTGSPGENEWTFDDKVEAAYLRSSPGNQKMGFQFNVGPRQIGDFLDVAFDAALLLGSPINLMIEQAEDKDFSNPAVLYSEQIGATATFTKVKRTHPIRQKGFYRISIGTDVLALAEYMIRGLTVGVRSLFPAPLPTTFQTVVKKETDQFVAIQGNPIIQAVNEGTALHIIFPANLVSQPAIFVNESFVSASGISAHYGYADSSQVFIRFLNTSTGNSVPVHTLPTGYEFSLLAYTN